MKLYKFLNARGASPFQHCAWGLPNGRPGKWMPKVERIRECISGYHVVRRGQALGWIDAQMFEVEGKGECLRGVEKIVYQQARLVRKVRSWNPLTQHLFAFDCDEHALRGDAYFPYKRQEIMLGRRTALCSNDSALLRTGIRHAKGAVYGTWSEDVWKLRRFWQYIDDPEKMIATARRKVERAEKASA